jgi:hypothetical protein
LAAQELAKHDEEQGDQIWRIFAQYFLEIVWKITKVTKNFGLLFPT